MYTYISQTGPFQPVRLIIYVDGKCWTLQCLIYEHIKIMVLKSGKFVPRRRMPCILTDVRVALATSVIQSVLEIPATDEIHICMEDRNETIVLPGGLA